MIVLGEHHLCRILSSCADYYNGTRTHLSLYKDALEERTTQPPEQGRIIEFDQVGGLHHQYLRVAA
jgi:hypothetical protein